MPVGSLEYSARVREEWIDYNGHLSEPYYVLIFGDATTAMMDVVGIDAEYRSATDSSLYTVEAHVRYLREVGRDAEVRVHTTVLSVSGKKLRLCHEMFHERSLVATEELLALHVSAGKATAFPEHIAARLECHIGKAPDYAGRAIYT
ncbi:thioesterase family protein [Sciscionella sediminilitoris]|uniref:thioesterase family protein n=1 Tax=Sciscionella sediminilitoris TaxID=1445613 RepID=UPI0004DF459F|nr:thioesterase family protein [Sciscionella sp. SE31]